MILKPLWSSRFHNEDLLFLKGLKDKCANSFLIISAFNESKVQKETRHYSSSILGEFVEIYVYIALQVSHLFGLQENFWTFLLMLRSPLSCQDNMHKGAFTYDALRVSLTNLPTLIRYALYYISLFSKIKCSLTHLHT